MSLRTPLGRVLGHGSAKDGTDHFISQRVSAIGLALLGTWFVIAMLGLESFAYLEVVRWIARPINAILLSLLSLTLAYHSWLGVQVVIEDYVHAAGAKTALLIGSRFLHIFIAVAAIYSVLRIGLSA